MYVVLNGFLIVGFLHRVFIGLFYSISVLGVNNVGHHKVIV